MYCLCIDRKLEHQIQAQQLKISEEKRLVAEIDILKRSKRNLKYVIEYVLKVLLFMWFPTLSVFYEGISH